MLVLFYLPQIGVFVALLLLVVASVRAAAKHGKWAAYCQWLGLAGWISSMSIDVLLFDPFFGINRLNGEVAWPAVSPITWAVILRSISVISLLLFSLGYLLGTQRLLASDTTETNTPD